LAVVLVSIIEFFLLEFPDVVKSVRIVRMLRLLHILSLDRIGNWALPEFKSFRNGLSNVFCSIFFIFGFYLILFTSYAVFGSLAFGGVTDFASWTSMTTLFKISTISGWDSVYDHIVKGGDCKMEAGNNGADCGHPTLGAFYIVTFLAINLLCFVNIYCALVMETMNQFTKEEQGEDVEATELDDMDATNEAGNENDVENVD